MIILENKHPHPPYPPRLYKINIVHRQETSNLKQIITNWSPVGESVKESVKLY